VPRALFVTDIDGTLLDEQARIPERNLALMRRAVDEGVVLALATGRRRSTYRRERARLEGIPHRVSCSNGAVLLGEDNESIAISHEMPWSALMEMAHGSPHPTLMRGIAVTIPPAAPIEEEEPDAWILTRDLRWHAAPSAWEPSTHWEVEGHVPRARPLVHSALEFATRGEAEVVVPRAVQVFGPGIDVHVVNVPRGPGAMVEAVVPGGKGLAIRDLAALLGIAADHTGAIGDDMNDASLLDAACHRYAVGGSVLAARRPDAHATCRSADGAVADALERFRAELG
jgi:3-deoxy-D-manno-octulosonate 8-phosphate phosphatase KdsC-like HAD superfamily phosphatase